MSGFILRSALGLALILAARTPAIADGEGDVCVYVTNNLGSYYDSNAVIAQPNMLEIWIANDAKLGGASWGFEITIQGNYEFIRDQSGELVFTEHNRAIDCWNMPDVQVLDSVDNDGVDYILIGGAAMPTEGMEPGPSDLAYIFYFYVHPNGTPSSGGGVCIRPIKYPPAGTWTSTDASGGYPPDFCGQRTYSETNPVATPVCYPIAPMSCDYPTGKRE